MFAQRATFLGLAPDSSLKPTLPESSPEHCAILQPNLPKKTTLQAKEQAGEKCFDAEQHTTQGSCTMKGQASLLLLLLIALLLKAVKPHCMDCPRGFPRSKL